jgi:hypothetical protein
MLRNVCVYIYTYNIYIFPNKQVLLKLGRRDSRYESQGTVRDPSSARTPGASRFTSRGG